MAREGPDCPGLRVSALPHSVSTFHVTANVNGTVQRTPKWLHVAVLWGLHQRSFFLRMEWWGEH